MKIVAGLLLLALTTAPALAQQPPRMGDAMQQRMSGRAAMLRALSNAHRNLLATIVGQLATSQNPDINGAAQRLDSVLTPAEKQSIIAAEKSMHHPGPQQQHSAGDVLLHVAMSFMMPAGPPQGPPQQ